MEPDRTIVYYTGHTERPEFEERIRVALLDAIGDLPLISVSQRPIDFGHNICVGEVGISIHNAWRQLQIGAEAATTPFICVAESDYLYPKEHFAFTPDKLDAFYMPTPLYMIYAQRAGTPVFRYKPTGCEGTLIVGREFLIQRIHEILDPYGTWSPLVARLHLFRRGQAQRFPVAIPPVMFKTDRGMTLRDHHTSDHLTTLPGWGDAATLLRTYVNPWNYDHLKHPRPYGSATTYYYALDWLKTCPLVEDWGCGPGYFGTLLPPDVAYHGLDTAVCPWGARESIDLASYTSQASGILIRHVLEHNFSWRTILKNALASFTKRMCLILFVPPCDGTEVVNRAPKGQLPEWELPKQALLDTLQPFLTRTLSINTRSQYGSETLYFLERPCQT
jgi:hypothetical protein